MQVITNNGVNITVVSKYLSYSSIKKTLDTYTHMFETSLLNVVNIINSLNKQEIKSYQIFASHYKQTKSKSFCSLQ